MNLQEQEEAEFGHEALWDAGEGVCCAAFQLGACEHTEAFDYEDEVPYPAWMEEATYDEAEAATGEEPF